MSNTTVLFMARTMRFNDFVGSLTSSIDAEVHVATPDSPAAARDFQLLVLDTEGARADRIDAIGAWLESRGDIPMLLIVEEDELDDLHLPTCIHADFICSGASEFELKARVQRLVGSGSSELLDDVYKLDNLVINLATYQVTIDGSPVDLTLMEYSLLSFLATHPDRVHSREALLRQVWGVEYCGGTRTVDVHIRRIRSKIGPQIAAHISTVRGVGYLFKE